jgi:hypothetical protein
MSGSLETPIEWQADEFKVIVYGDFIPYYGFYILNVQCRVNSDYDFTPSFNISVNVLSSNLTFIPPPKLTKPIASDVLTEALGSIVEHQIPDIECYWKAKATANLGEAFTFVDFDELSSRFTIAPKDPKELGLFRV